MAINPQDWSRRANITGATPAATLTGFVALITGANLPAEIWTTAKNGGGDLRVCIDKDGLNELPIEVVKFDTVAQEAVLWVRFPSYSAANNGIWIFYGNTGAIAYSELATFGRNAVWSDFEYVFHFSNQDLTIDSTGRYSALVIGSPGTILDHIGDGGFDGFSSPNNRCNISGYTGPEGSSQRTHNIWFRGTGSDTGLLEYGKNVTNQRFTLRLESGLLRLEVAGGYRRGQSFAINDGEWHSSVIKANGASAFHSAVTFAVDGQQETTYATAGSPLLDTVAQSDVEFGAPLYSRPTEQFGEHWLRLFATTNEQDATEYSNQNSPETFWTIQTVESTGSASPEDYTGALPAASGYASATIDAYKNIYGLFISYAIAQATGQAIKGTLGSLLATGTGTGATDGQKATSSSQNAQAYGSASTDGYKVAAGLLAAAADATASVYGNKTGYGTLQAQATALATLQAGEGETLSRVGTITVQAFAGQPAQTIQGNKGSQADAQVNATGTTTAAGTKATNGIIQAIADAIYTQVGTKGSAGSLGQAMITGSLLITGNKASAGSLAAAATISLSYLGIKVTTQALQVTATATNTAYGHKATGELIQAFATATVRFFGYTDSVIPRYQTIRLQGLLVRHVFIGVRRRYSLAGVINNV